MSTRTALRRSVATARDKDTGGQGQLTAGSRSQPRRSKKNRCSSVIGTRESQSGQANSAGELGSSVAAAGAGSGASGGAWLGKRARATVLRQPDGARRNLHAQRRHQLVQIAVAFCTVIGSCRPSTMENSGPFIPGARMGVRDEGNVGNVPLFFGMVFSLGVYMGSVFAGGVW